MKHDFPSPSEPPSFVVNDVDVSFNDWAARDFVPKELRERIRSAKILITPELDRDEKYKILFPVGTEDLFLYLRKAFSDAEVEIPVADSNYVEIALHGDIKRLGSFLVISVVLPLFLGVLSTYISDELHVAEKDQITFSITVTDGSRAKNFTFSGDVKAFNKVSKDIQKLWEAKNESP